MNYGFCGGDIFVFVRTIELSRRTTGLEYHARKRKFVVKKNTHTHMRTKEIKFNDNDYYNNNNIIHTLVLLRIRNRLK